MSEMTSFCVEWDVEPQLKCLVVLQCRFSCPEGWLLGNCQKKAQLNINVCGGVLCHCAHCI